MLRYDFDSLGAWAQHAEEHGSDAKGTPMSSDWYGASFREAVGLARAGWGEGADMARAKAATLGELVGSRVLHHAPFPNVEGLEIDMGAYTAGVPECWIDVVPEYQPAGGQVVRVLVNVSASSSVRAASVINKGVAVAALVSALEVAGRSGEVVVAEGAKGRPGGDAEAAAYITIKRAGEPLDLSALTFATAHPAMMRRLGFAWLDRLAAREGIDCKAPGYGYPASVPREGFDIYVPENLTASGVRDRWIYDQLRAQGVEVSDAA